MYSYNPEVMTFGDHCMELSPTEYVYFTPLQNSSGAHHSLAQQPKLVHYITAKAVCFVCSGL